MGEQPLFPSYNMDAYVFHMAVATLAGASVAALSCYFLHRKSLAQLLEFALMAERVRVGGQSADSSCVSKRKGRQRRGLPMQQGRRMRQRPGGAAGWTAEGANGLVMEKSGDAGKKDRCLSWIDSLPEGTYETGQDYNVLRVQ
ncbi:hypothetical protein HPP92_023457 [Vanilla planifolia]|uniref:Uncharacterized protein n=1 Tax=Vanilla planifolia TaxID=51239 RepID=A0A835UES8_VANPL|nr:hypothetical protein HPP92_023457 [Vanilla planifolia]